MKIKNDRDAVQELLERFSQGEKATISKSIIERAHAADIAEIIANVSDERQRKVFEALDKKQKGDVFIELPEDIQSEFLDDADDERLFSLLSDLEPDEAVDLLNLLPSGKQHQILSKLPPKLGHKLRKLLLYSEESAGGIMTPILLSVYEDETVEDVIEKMRAYQYEEVITNVYIVDNDFILVGYLPLQSIIIAEKKTNINEIMKISPISVNVHDDQEIVSQTVRKYNLLSVPVLEENGQLVGRITLDDIIDIVHEEADEDMYKMAGVDIDEVHVESGFQVARMRMPWLSLCLGGSMISAFVLQSFQGILSQSVMLISFLPAICAMGGNSGLQTSTVTIRNLNYGAVFHTNRKKLVRRELLSGIIIGITCGIFVAILSSVWLQNSIYGLIIGSSMIITIIFSTCTGFFIPIFFNRLKIDPAIASGPLITTLNDAMSAFIYLTMASIQLKLFGVI